MKVTRDRGYLKEKAIALIALLMLAASIVVLLFWCAFGNPADQVEVMQLLSSWWLLIAAMFAFVLFSERKRRNMIRLMFVGKDSLYNATSGVVHVRTSNPVRYMEHILRNITYGNDFCQPPSGGGSAFKWLVSTKCFKENGSVWKGTVTAVGASGQVVAFNSKEELESLILA